MELMVLLLATGSGGDTNKMENDYVAWNWKANGSGSSNTDGQHKSTVSVNTTAGFLVLFNLHGTGSNLQLDMV